MRPVDSADPARAELPQWAGLAGIGFGLLLLYALLGPPWPPDGNAPAAVWQAHLGSTAVRLELLAATLAATVAGLLFVTFMACLLQRGLLPARSAFASLGYGCGLLFVACIFAAFCAWVTIPGGIQISREPMPSGDLIRYFNDLGQAFITFPAPLCAGVFAIVVSRRIRATATIPRWLGSAGLLVGVAQLAGMFFFPLLLFPVWVGLVGAALARQPRSADHSATAATLDFDPAVFTRR
jgi:hypothetical protein